MAEAYHSIEYLSSKIQNWNSDFGLSFHTSEEKAYPEKAECIWEAANTAQYDGVLHYGKKFATYYSAVGDEYVLTSKFDNIRFNIDWRANRALYQRSLNSANKFKMVNPIGFNEGYNMGSYEKVGIYRVTNINETNFVYFKLKHPNSNLGSHHTFSVPGGQRVQFFVDNLTPLLYNITSVLAEDNTITGYPSIKYDWLCTSSGSPYWRMLYKWVDDAETCFARVIGELQIYIQTEEKNGNLIPLGIETYAREEWKKALNI
jgi:hypothetical protein